MILELIISAFLALANMIIGLLPVLDFQLPTGFLNGATVLFQYTGYFFPVGAMVLLFVAKLALNNLGLIMAIISRIKSFIPFMGK